VTSHKFASLRLLGQSSLNFAWYNLPSHYFNLSQLALFPQLFSEAVKNCNSRQCIICSRYLQPSCFPNHCNNKDGLDRRCRSCIRQQSKVRSTLKARFPSPPPGPCPICHKHTEQWVLDHCHTTNAFRGHICTSCNLALGKFYDSPAIVKSALDYLLATMPEV